MQAVLDLETRIAEITAPPEERRDEEKIYHLMSIAELDELAPFVSTHMLSCSHESLSLVVKMSYLCPHYHNTINIYIVNI